MSTIKTETAVDQPDDIDYLHPDGKPVAKIEPVKTEEEKVEETRSVEKSIQEADGHHVCSDACQRDHKV